PFSSRMIHCRSAVGPEPWSVIEPSIESARLDRSLPPAGGTIGIPTFVLAFLRILNMCPQLVHLTVTPPGFKRLSSSSYSVWHFSQRTSIAFRVLAPRLPRRFPPCML